MGSTGKSVKENNAYSANEISISQKQRDWELDATNRTAQDDLEHGAYFDKDGNILFDDFRNDRFGDLEIPSLENDWDTHVKFNHEVEKRIWNDEEVNFTHTHNLNSIFSPEDIESFENIENHSIRAILPNKTTYTLIREQPRTSNAWILDTKTGDFKREFEPLKIAPHYTEYYEKLYMPEYNETVNLYKEGKINWTERNKRIDALAERITPQLENWLSKNASKYGYSFKKEKRK